MNCLFFTTIQVAEGESCSMPANDMAPEKIMPRAVSPFRFPPSLSSKHEEELRKRAISREFALASVKQGSHGPVQGQGDRGHVGDKADGAVRKAEQPRTERTDKEGWKSLLCLGLSMTSKDVGFSNQFPRPLFPRNLNRRGKFNERRGLPADDCPRKIPSVSHPL